VLFNNSIEKYSFYSFKFVKSHFNIIENNTITDTEKAFYLSESDDNIIKFNAAFSNGRGIQDYNSLRNNISFNIFQNTAEAAIDLSGSSYFNIHHNSFFFNNLESSSQSIDNGQYNLWFDTVLLKGNYWNDYNDTGYYQIGGTANSTDPYPLTEPLSYSYSTQIPDNIRFFYTIQNLILRKIAVFLIE
jgi:parallel beta-helix repeat protein